MNHTPQRPLARILPWGMRLIWVIFGISMIVAIGSVVMMYKVNIIEMGFPVKVEFSLSSERLNSAGLNEIPLDEELRIGSLRGQGALRTFGLSLDVILIALGRSILINGVAAFLVLLMIHQLVFSYVSDRPFDPRNARRLSMIGWILLVRAVVDFGLHTWTQFRMADFVGLNGNGFSIQPSIDYVGLGPFVYAFLFFMLGEMFHRGTQLQAENDLTV